MDSAAAPHSTASIWITVGVRTRLRMRNDRGCGFAAGAEVMDGAALMAFYRFTPFIGRTPAFLPAEAFAAASGVSRKAVRQALVPLASRQSEPILVRRKKELET
jgi:hypothetical protein